MHRKIVVVSQILAVLAIVPVEAAELPRYDVKSYCTQVSESIGGSEQIRAACFGQEQTAYTSLKARWDNVPEKTQAYCDSVARTVGSSYQIFNACVDQELQASNSPQEFKY